MEKSLHKRNKYKHVFFSTAFRRLLLDLRISLRSLERPQMRWEDTVAQNARRMCAGAELEGGSSG